MCMQLATEFNMGLGVFQMKITLFSFAFLALLASVLTYYMSEKVTSLYANLH